MRKNRRMKKGMMGLAAAALTLTCAFPAAANDTMEVGYQEDSYFTLSIPAKVELDERAEQSQTITLSYMNVGTKEKVQVKVKEGITDGAVTLTDVKDETNTAASTVSLTTGGEGIADGAVVAEFWGEKDTFVDASKDGTLYFSALGDVPAGTYSGKIVFTAEIVEKN